MKVLIVDDDQILVDKIAEGMDWKSLGVERVYTANTVWQAREILGETDINLIIADIEMPGGSGLELIRWTKEQQMGCECIFISSHASFAYAQEALKLRSSQYLLKPVTNKVLYESVKQVLDRIRIGSGTDSRELEGQKRRLWIELVEKTGNGQPDPEAQKRIGKLFDKGQSFFMLLLKDVAPKGEHVPDGRSIDGYRLQEIAERKWHSVSAACEAAFLVSEGRWMVIGSGVRDSVEAVAEILREGLSEEGRECNVFYIEKSALSLGDGFDIAKELLETASKAIPEGVCCLNVLQWKERREHQLDARFQGWKDKICTEENLQLLKEDICVCLEKECAQARVTKGTLGKVRSLLSQMIFSWLEHKKLQRSILFDEEEFQHGFENCVYSLESMKWFLDWIFGKMAGYQSMDTRKENVVDKIKEYIDSHLQEELSRERLAGMVYLSAGHISRIFRDEVGMPLSNYVIMRRMEKAKEYLRTTNLGVSEIAMKVGYTNFSYFSMTFKDYTGCTPNEFRRKG